MLCWNTWDCRVLLFSGGSIFVDISGHCNPWIYIPTNVSNSHIFVYFCSFSWMWWIPLEILYSLIYQKKIVKMCFTDKKIRLFKVHVFTLKHKWNYNIVAWYCLWMLKNDKKTMVSKWLPFNRRFIKIALLMHCKQFKMEK